MLLGIIWITCFVLVWRPAFRMLYVAASKDTYHTTTGGDLLEFVVVATSIALFGPVVVLFFAVRAILSRRNLSYREIAKRIAGVSRSDRKKELQARIRELEHDVLS